MWFMMRGKGKRKGPDGHRDVEEAIAQINAAARAFEDLEIRAADSASVTVTIAFRGD